MPTLPTELRVSIDTNIFVSAVLYPERTPGQLLHAWRAGRFQVVLSMEHEQEIRLVLDRSWLEQKYGIQPQVKADILLSLELTEPVAGAARLPLVVRDPDDEKILAEALGGQADFLVTGDDDLLSLADAPELGELRIVTTAEFLNHLMTLDAQSSERDAA